MTAQSLILDACQKRYSSRLTSGKSVSMPAPLLRAVMTFGIATSRVAFGLKDAFRKGFSPGHLAPLDGLR